MALENTITVNENVQNYLDDLYNKLYSEKWEAYKDFSHKNFRVLPGPLQIELKRLLDTKHQFSNYGYYFSFVAGSKPSEIEVFLKSNMTTLNALNETYPEYNNLFRIDAQYIQDEVDKIKMLNSVITKDVTKKDLEIAFRKINQHRKNINDEILSYYKRIDKALDLNITPSDKYLKIEEQINDELKSIYGKLVVRTKDNEKVYRANIPVVNNYIAQAKRKDKEYSTRIRMLNSVKTTMVGSNERKLLVDLAIARHNFHAKDYLPFAMDPGNNSETIDMIDKTSSTLKKYKIGDLGTGYYKSIKNAVKSIRECAQRFENVQNNDNIYELTEEYHALKEDLDNAIISYLKETDKYLKSNLTPERRERNQELYKNITRTKIKEEFNKIGKQVSISNPEQLKNKGEISVLKPKGIHLVETEIV